jgi:hypothetical protein
MSQEPNVETEFIVEDSEENFSSWINRPYVPEELRNQLVAANVLIVPREGFRERPDPVFPVGTEELLQYFRGNSDKGISADICIADEDYRELALHEALIIIGGFVVTSLVAPIVTDLISTYIKKRWGSKEEKAKIKLELTVVEKDGRASKLLYEGPSKDFSKTVKPALKTLSERNGQGNATPNPKPGKELEP